MPVIPGDGGSNVLAGGSTDDTILGFGGDDTLIGNGGRDSLDGGAGFDTADFAGTVGDLDVDLEQGVERAVTNSALAGIEAVVGGSGDDAIAGDGGANRLDGRGGDDSLNGAGGDDTLIGGPGGNVLDGGAGRDTADYGWATGAALINLADGTAEVDDPSGPLPAAVDSLSNIEAVLGGAGNDTLDGGAGSDSMAGGDGDDTYRVDRGDDVVVELPGGGTDTVLSSVNLALVAEVENLVLTGGAAINGSGNGLNNTLTGNGASNPEKRWSQGMFSFYVDPERIDPEHLFGVELSRFFGYVKSATPIDAQAGDGVFDVEGVIVGDDRAWAQASYRWLTDEPEPVAAPRETRDEYVMVLKPTIDRLTRSVLEQ